MRVLIQPRPIAATQRGGDYLQLEATLEGLSAIGVQADVSTAFDADLTAYDVCLIWHSGEALPALHFYTNARRQNKPVAIMPIYWSLARLWQTQRFDDQGEPNAWAREFQVLWRRAYTAQQAILLRGADALLPNSTGEAAQLMADFQIPSEKIRVVLNGVAADFAQGDAARFRAQFQEAVGAKDFLLCIAQLAPRKNQLTLLEALRADTRLLVLMGGRESEVYARLCDAAAAQRGRVVILPPQPRQTVADALAAARIHVLVSGYDIAPLASMEAAMAGTPQVITNECGMRDYFGAAAWYVDPDDPAQIRQAIDAAWNAPRALALSERLQREFTWQRTSHELAAALEWTVARPRQTVDVSAEWLAIAETREAQEKVFFQWLSANNVEARALDQWAQELNANLLARQAAASHSWIGRFKRFIKW